MYMLARKHCRISPSCLLAECRKRRLNQGSFFVLLYFALFDFLDIVYLVSVFPVLFCLLVSAKRLAVKTASEMT